MIETDDELIARLLRQTETKAETDDELISRLLKETEPTLGESIVGSAKALVGGVVNTGSEALRGAGKLADAMRPYMGPSFGSGESVFSAGGEALAGVAPEVNPYVAGSIPGQLASGVGQVGGLLGLGLINPALGFEAAFLGGVSETERQIADEAVNADGGASMLAMLGGGVINTADMIPLAGPWMRINRILGGVPAVAAMRLGEMRKIAASTGALATAGRIGTTTALETVTEGTQKLLTNALVNHATDQELDLMRGVLPEAGVGGGVGSILETVVELATRKRRKMMASAAAAGIPDAEYRLRLANDPAFAAAENKRIDDEIALEMAETVQSAIDNPPEATITDEAGQLVEDFPTPGGDFTTGLAGIDPTSVPAFLEGRNPSLPNRPSRPDLMSVPTEQDIPRYADGTPAEPGVYPGNPDEYTPKGSGPAWRPSGPMRQERDIPTYPDGTPVPEGVRLSTSEYRTTGPSSPQDIPPVSSTTERAPFQPSPVVRAAPSTEALVPVQGQSGPGGQPVYLITGSRPGMPWGGTRDNVIGATAPTSLGDIGKALQTFLRSFGDIAAQRRAAGGITGSFDAGGVVTADVNDVQSLVHEAGHLLHRWVMANQRSGTAVAANPNAVLDALPPVVQGEIRNLAYAGHAPGRELPEGFAELMRMWVTIPEVARARAPQAVRWLESWLTAQPRSVSAPLLNAQQRAHDFRFQGNQLRRVVHKDPPLLERASANLQGTLPRIVRRIYDDTRILKAIHPKLQQLWRSIRGTSRGMLQNFVSGKPTDFNGNELPEGINYESILRGIGIVERKLFSEYLVARATLALEPKGVNTGKAPAEAKNLVAELDQSHPHFAQALNDLQRWMAQVNRVVADASPTYAAGMRNIEAHDQFYGIDIYVPLHRWLTQTRAGQMYATGRSSLKDNVSREREGSPADVKDPLSAYVYEASRRFEQAIYRNLIESTIAVFDATGGNAGPNKVYLREITAEEAGAQVLDYGPESSIEGMLTALASPELVGDQIPVTVRVIDPVTGKPKDRYFFFDRRLAEVVATVDPATLRNGTSNLIRMASMARRSVSTFQIVMNPGFQFFTNVLMDTPMAYLTSSYFKPHELLALVGYTSQNILDNLRATFSLSGKKGKWAQAYENLALHSSAGLAGERAVGRTVRGISSVRSPGNPTTATLEYGRGKLANMWEGLAQFMSIPQRSVQIALMQKAAKVHGIDITQRLTADEANILRAAARQPVDYNAGGDLSRAWSQVIPFLRPALDSQRQLTEAAKRNPFEFFSKIGVLMGVYTAIRYAFGDDEVERRKTATDAMRSISIPAFDGNMIEIRVPGEIAWMVLAPTALVESMHAEGQDPTDFVMGGVRNMLPPGPGSIPIVNLIASQWTGKQNPVGSLFFEEDQAPVVPNALQGMDGLAQQTPATAPVAIMAANMFHTALSPFLPETNPLMQAVTSPIRLESAIRNLMGGHGLLMVEGYNLVPGLRTQREAEPADVLAGVFRRGGDTSWNDRYIREVYELNKIAMQKKATLNGAFEEPMDRLRREMLGRTAATISVARYLSTFEEQGMTRAGRMALARASQDLAKKTVEATKRGELPTYFYGLEAQVGVRRGLYDLDRGVMPR